ncbi:hypothetical protein [Streptomyces sp. NPDC048639]|uniref:hypothetical protein n=1 Tax=Streptomyces sp. NPDC048639 TaxID=3365581 RepID=UPI00371EFF84
MGDQFQQNTAQSSRQNNNGSNPNNLVLTLFGARNTDQCRATEVSRTIGTINHGCAAAASRKVRPSGH